MPDAAGIDEEAVDPAGAVTGEPDDVPFRLEGVRVDRLEDGALRRPEPGLELAALDVEAIGHIDLFAVIGAGKSLEIGGRRGEGGNGFPLTRLGPVVRLRHPERRPGRAGFERGYTGTVGGRERRRG